MTSPIRRHDVRIGHRIADSWIIRTANGGARLVLRTYRPADEPFSLPGRRGRVMAGLPVIRPAFAMNSLGIQHLKQIAFPPLEAELSHLQRDLGLAQQPFFKDSDKSTRRDSILKMLIHLPNEIITNPQKVGLLAPQCSQSRGNFRRWYQMGTGKLTPPCSPSRPTTPIASRTVRLAHEHGFKVHRPPDSSITLRRRRTVGAVEEPPQPVDSFKGRR